MMDTHMHKPIFYTSLAPSAASWDTSSDKSESQLKLFNLEKLMHSSICMYAHWMEGKKKKWQLVCHRHTFRSCQLASPMCDSGAIQTEQKQESKRAEGENMAAENYHFHIKRMLSQQSNKATPVNCDTVQLLIRLSKARGKPTVSRASALFIK